MKIAVDLHGFLDSYAPVLTKLLAFLREFFDIEVYVMSGPEESEIRQELNKLGYLEDLHYDKIFSIVDYLKEIKDPNLYQDENKHWWTLEKTWWSSKGKFCEREGVHTVFDDKIEYYRYMPAGVKFYLIERNMKKDPEMSKIRKSLNLSPSGFFKDQ